MFGSNNEHFPTLIDEEYSPEIAAQVIKTWGKDDIHEIPGGFYKLAADGSEGKTVGYLSKDGQFSYYSDVPDELVEKIRVNFRQN